MKPDRGEFRKKFPVLVPKTFVAIVVVDILNVPLMLPVISRVIDTRVPGPLNCAQVMELTAVEAFVNPTHVTSGAVINAAFAGGATNADATKPTTPNALQPIFLTMLKTLLL